MPLARVAAAVAVVTLAMASGAPQPAIAGGMTGPPDVTVERVAGIGPAIGRFPFPTDQSFDPIVATHPTDPDRIAVSYHRWRAIADGCDGPALVAGLRLSRDGGRTWREATATPWAGSGRRPNWHATIAWGPGPRPGRARLYWADTTVSGCGFGDHRLSIAWSDDEGSTWSDLFLLGSVPATGEGGYPDITVDRHPGSPNRGVVYATINWFAHDGAEPGLRVLASADRGRTWSEAEVPPVPAPDGYPFSYRIGGRLRPTPDGGLVLAWHQVDATDAGRSRIGRNGFGFTSLRFDRRTHEFAIREPSFLRSTSVNGIALGTEPAPGTTDTLRLRPRWTMGLDVDPTSGRILVALADLRATAPPGQPRGVVRVGRSDDGGLTWRWARIADLPAVGSRRVSAHLPSMVVARDVVVVGIHGIVDLPRGVVAGRLASIGEAFAVSTDGGVTFGDPRPLSGRRWELEALRTGNRTGLRERMEATVDGDVVWAFADGRDRGRSRIVLARLDRQPVPSDPGSTSDPPPPPVDLPWPRVD